ncbi:sigma-E factor negative regulatory protein [Thiomonas sp. FB-Cd]|uniref:sigma-E factor negative regulatory protein n=1 Tax=Thiomonas sp. FB-Cd TaxID=1158292 RepID=UPI00068B043F|nr:sigma-E factor negative regulatory protein [Thiomonas sp. FB-Cd]
MEQFSMKQPMMPARISALMDGEFEGEGLALDSAALDDALRELSSHEAARDTWLQYHQIGDLLRSSELVPLADERAFIQRFSERLSREPVQCLPRAVRNAQREKDQASQRGRRHWSAVGAAVASVAAVALVSFSTWPSRHDEQSIAGRVQSGLQALPTRVISQRTVALTATHARGEVPVVLGVADQQAGSWAQYLMAHQQLAGSVLPYSLADIHEAEFRVAASR